MEIGLYLPGESVIHQADPRLKIGGLVGLGFLITAAKPLGLISLTAGLLILLLLSHIPLEEFKAVLLAGLLLGSFYILILSWNWSETWHFWEGHWSRQGLILALLINWRISLVFIFTRIFTAVTLPSEQGSGIAYFFTPFYRFTPKVADFALLITLTLRFIPLLIEDASLLYKARVAKGCLPSGRIKKLFELASFLVPLLLLTLRRAEEVADNLVARGYMSGGYRVFGTKEWGSEDTWGVLILAVWVMATLILNNLTAMTL